MRLTRLGRGIVASSAVLLVVGVVLGLTPVIALAYSGFAMVGLAVTAVVESPSISVRRSAAPPEVERTAPASVTLELRASPRRRQRPFTVIETVAGERRAAAVPGLAPGDRTAIVYDVDTSRRGTVTSGPLLLRRIDPFGLVVAERRVSGSCSVAVRPRRHHLRMLPTGRQRDLEGPTREVSEGSSSFHQLREYVPGDDLRHIHWKTSARTGTLVVKQLVDTTKPEIVVIVDNRRSAVGEADFEEVVEIAASVLHAADQDGFPSQLLFADGSEGGGGRAQIDVLDGSTVSHLDRLTDVRTTESDSMLEMAEALRARGRSLIFVTGELGAPDLTLLARIASGFSPAYLVSVAGERKAPLVAPPGVVPIACASAREFAATWAAHR